MRYDLTVNKGAFITEIAAGSPAEKAGLGIGDVIVKWDDREIASADDLIQAIHSHQIGDEVEITFWRGNKQYTTTATLAERPSPK